MRTRGPALVIMCLVLALLWAWPAAAQEQSGSIEGVVKDSSGGVLPGVTVEARSNAVVGDFRFGTSVGLNALFQSGLQPGATLDINGYPVFITTRNSLERTPFQQRYDLYVQHDITLHGNQRININMNIDNVFDLKTITDWNQTVNRNTLYIDDATFFAGFDWKQLMADYQAEGNNMRRNPLVVDSNWNINPKPYSFMGRRAVRIGAKYSF